MRSATTLRWRLGVLLVSLLVLNAFLPALAKQSTLDGETIFRGVLFGDAPVAHLFPEYYPMADAKSASSTQTPATKAKQDAEQEVVSSLRRRDASFFDHFAKELQSGDPVRVSQELQQAEQTFRTVAEDFNPQGLHALHGSGHPPILASWFDMSDLEKDQLASRIAERLGPASKIQ